MTVERKLKVSFDEPEHGWIAITMSVDDEQFMLVPSHVPYDSIAELAAPLNNILEGYSEVVERWNEGLAEYEFVFRVCGGSLKRDVYEVTSVQGGIRRNSVWTFIGPRD